MVLLDDSFREATLPGSKQVGALSFRWLGAAGIELTAGGTTLVIDPFLTRFPAWKTWFGKVEPRPELAARLIPHCDFVLVTHSHWDHIMDVPAVIEKTGATALGSENSCRLLAASGVPREKIRRAKAGTRLALHSFELSVLKAEHRPILGFSSGSLMPNLRPPLRARDYRMDVCYCFLVRANGHRLLTDPGTRPRDAVRAELLFVYPGMGRDHYEVLLDVVCPRVVIPIHWDDFFRPLSRPLRPYWKPPSLALPPLQRVNLADFEQMVHQIAPSTRVYVPKVLQVYDLGELIRMAH